MTNALPTPGPTITPNAAAGAALSIADMQTAATFAADLAQCVQAIVVVVAALWAYRQLRESMAARRAAVSLQLLERLNDETVMLRKRQLHARIKRRINRPSEKDQRILSQIANEYHAIGYVLKLGLIDPKVVLGIHYAAVCRAWAAMEPWIMRERARRGTLYAEYFEYLRDAALEYMRSERPTEYLAQRW